MGWQDAPVTTAPAPAGGGDQPAWMKAPVVGAPAAAPVAPRPDATVGNTLGGVAELLASGVGNIPHAALHAGVDLARRITGGDTNAPDPGIVQATEVPVGDAAKNLVARVQDARGPHELQDKMSTPQNATLRDLGEQTNSVAGDVMNLLPAVGAVKGITGAIGGAGDAVAAAANPASNATKAGYKFLPSSAQRIEPAMKLPTIASNAEGISGSGNVLKPLQTGNQLVTNKLAASDIGLAPDTPRFTDTLFANTKQPQQAVYTEVGNKIGDFKATPDLGTDLASISERPALDPKTRQAIKAQVAQYDQTDWQGPEAIKTISALRSRARNQIGSPDVATQDLGIANRQTADAIETELERQASVIKDGGDLVSRYQAARQQLAKINNVQDSVRAGQPDAAIIKKLKDSGVPLSGGLAQIAESAEHFPQELAHPQSVGGGAPAPEVPTTAAGMLQKVGSKLIGRLATSPGSQEAIGRSMSADPLPNRVTAAPLPEAPVQPSVPFAPTSGAPGSFPPQAMAHAGSLAGDLELAGQSTPANLPAASGRPADLTLAPDAGPQGGVPFTPPNGTGQAPTLASDLSLAPDHQGGSLPGGQAPNATSLAGDLGLKENARVQPKIPAKAADLAGDLGVTDFRDQRPLSNPGKKTPPVPDNAPPGVPAGRSVHLADDLGLNPNQTGKAAELPKANNAKLAIQENVKGDELPDEHILPGSTLITHAGEDGATKGFMAYRENDDGQLQLSRTSVDPAARGGGIGKAMLVEAAEQAAKAGKPLVSDGSVTVDQLRVYESLKKAGKLDFSYADPKAVKTALAGKDGRVTVKGKGGTPVVTDIRPYEGEADGTG